MNANTFIPKTMIFVFTAFLLILIGWMTVILNTFYKIYDSVYADVPRILQGANGYILHGILALGVCIAAKIAWPKKPVTKKFYLYYFLVVFFVALPLFMIYLGFFIPVIFEPILNSQ